LEQTELSKIGDKNQSVLLEVAECLRLGGERVKVVVGGLDFHNSALGVLENWRRSVPALATGLREEPTVGHTRALIAELG
jgi:hypothetical protein